MKKNIQADPYVELFYSLVFGLMIGQRLMNLWAGLAACFIMFKLCELIDTQRKKKGNRGDRKMKWKTSKTDDMPLTKNAITNALLKDVEDNRGSIIKLTCADRKDAISVCGRLFVLRNKGKLNVKEFTRKDKVIYIDIREVDKE